MQVNDSITEQSRSSPFRFCSLLSTHKRPRSEKRSFLPLHMQAIPVLNDSQCSNGAFPLALCCSPAGRLLLLTKTFSRQSDVTSGAGGMIMRAHHAIFPPLGQRKTRKSTLPTHCTRAPLAFCRELVDVSGTLV